MVKLSKEIMESLNDPETIKTLSTTDESGNPETVFEDTLVALDEESLAYLEMIETSNTYKNMLRNFWQKKQVSITVYNEKRGISCQIKAEPYRWAMDDALWDRFLYEAWKKVPDADPSGVWIIKPIEIIDEHYEAKRQAETDRRPRSRFWYKYLGPRS